MKKYDVTIVGYLCADLIPEFKDNGSLKGLHDFLKPGRIIEIDGLGFSPGGVVANTGLAMKRFNKKVYLNGLTGDDFIGKVVREWLDKYNLGDGIKITETAGSAFGIVLGPPGVDRIFLESPGCNEFLDNSEIDLDIIANSRILHFGYPPLLKQFFLNDGAKLVSLFSQAKQSGAITSLDLSLPDPESESGKVDWLKLMKGVLPHTDVFVPSLEEVLQILMPAKYQEISLAAGDSDIIDLVPMELIREVGMRIIGYGVKILLIKMAHRGAYLVTGDVSSINTGSGFDLNEESWNYCELLCNAYPVDQSRFKNASGAGDTATAAFLSSLLSNELPETALKYASLAGRNNLYCNDAYVDLASWEDMTEEMQLVPNEIINLKDYQLLN